MEITLWLALAALGLVGCGLCAGLETGVYCLNRVRLQVRAHQGWASARILARLMSPPNALIASLLIGTNLATNVATSATGIVLEAQGLDEFQVILFDWIIVTPLLMVFAETLPKDLFAAQADRIVYPFARPLLLMRRFFTWIGAIPAINALNWLVQKLLDRKRKKIAAPALHPRLRVGTLVKEGVGFGLLSDEQSSMVERVLSLSDRTLRDEMVPWEKVVTVRTGDPSSVLWALAENTRYSRFPLVDEGGRVVGVVNLYDALQFSKVQCPPLTQLAGQALLLDRKMPLRAALAKLQSSHVGLAVVVKGERPMGVVTVKDLIEPITGELANW